MKKLRLITVLCFITLATYGQISVELIGGIGYDLNKFENKFFRHREPLTHSYSYQGDLRGAKFSILEPKTAGVRGLWKFWKKQDLSIGLEGRYISRDIIGTFHLPENQWTFNEMDINIAYYDFGLFLRKNIALNSKNEFFIQINSNLKYYPYPRGVFNTIEGTERIHESNWQLVQYREGEEYYNLIEIEASGIATAFSPRFTQGFITAFTEHLKFGISTTFVYDVDWPAQFIIWSWNNAEQRKNGSYSPTYLRFSTVTFDLFMVYEF